MSSQQNTGKKRKQYASLLFKTTEEREEARGLEHDPSNIG